METNEKNELIALHHFTEARRRITKGMIALGIAEDERDWEARFSPVFELLCDGAVQSSDKTIDQLTLEAREKLKDIREVDT